MKYLKGRYFHSEIKEGIYLIGCQFLEEGLIPSWNEMGDQIRFGPPTGNSWLIVGEEKGLLIDSCAPVEGLKEYVESLAGKRVDILISHGHYDHIFMVSEFSSLYLHEKDLPLFHGYLGFPEYEDIPEELHFLEEGDEIDLGNRILQVYHIEGHSNGSIMLLDKKSGILFSGDSIARRILLYDIDESKVVSYFNKIRKMKEEPFDLICSAHDRIPLHKEYIDFMFDHLDRISLSYERRKLFEGRFGEFYSLKLGDESTEEYLNCSILCEYRNVLLKTIDDIRRMEK